MAVALGGKVRSIKHGCNQVLFAGMEIARFEPGGTNAQTDCRQLEDEWHFSRF